MQIAEFIENALKFANVSNVLRLSYEDVCKDVDAALDLYVGRGWIVVAAGHTPNLAHIAVLTTDTTTLKIVKALYGVKVTPRTLPKYFKGVRIYDVVLAAEMAAA